MAFEFLPTYKRDRNKAQHDWLSGSYAYRVALLKSGGPYNPAWEFFSDINMATNEVSVAGYVRKDLASRVLIPSGNDYILGCANPQWASLAVGQDVIAAVLGKFTTGDPDSAIELVCWMDGGTSPHDLPWATDGGPFEVDFSQGFARDS